MQEMLLTYQQTNVNAFQEVSNSLIAYQKGREFREQQESLTTASGPAALTPAKRIIQRTRIVLQTPRTYSNSVVSHVRLGRRG